ncbi:S41 family peptidase [Gammaproteobacteria bacterium]|nr:S41 family peptidase [Gammaproteobacteria bacterium]MBT7814808.1 S41 family peptidase [Gammaproteobacteria bacterium]MDA9896734.1 S41 family peptidase [Gammaproteobacteria bacterium]
MKFIKNKNILFGFLAIFSISTLFYFKDSNHAYAAKTNLPLNQLQAFSEVYLKIKQNYVQDVSDKELFDNAIKGMLEGLDPHSTFLNEKDFKDLKIGTKGEFGGLGIEVTMEDGFVKVITPIDDTPAFKAGVKPGDLIIEIDGGSVKGLSLNQAVDLMRGKVGEPILLSIARKGENGPLEIKIVRAKIKVKSVKYEIIHENYGYIRISSFQNKTGKNLYDAISDLNSKSKGNIKGYVIDMRNNPGGVLGAAVDVSDAFIKGKKKLVFTKGRSEDAMYEFKSNNIDLAEEKPIVVLINGGSASASEIVAGALQDHKRAIIMGTQSFGKGSVQTILPITSKTAVKITTARYYTPNGRSIQATGITPDIIVKDRELSSSLDNKMLKESDLKGHLKNSDKKKNEDVKEAQDKRLEKDYQLSEAINLLKGLNIMSSNKN